MKVLVTGDACFIGSNLGRQLLADGLRATILEDDFELPLSDAARRLGDSRDSLADIGIANSAFGFELSVTMDEDLPKYIRWARAEAAA
jgi:nucleoside-diphosphate-sugar epimerase